MPIKGLKARADGLMAKGLKAKGLKATAQRAITDERAAVLKVNGGRNIKAKGLKG